MFYSKRQVKEMFGYIAVDEPELKMKDYRKYKAYYCGLCRALQKRYGSAGQLTLSYDMTFLAVLLTSLYESETEISQRRCKIHPFKKQTLLCGRMTDYAADMNLILAYYHQKDDWEDEKKLSGILGMVSLKRKVKKVIREYPRQCETIRKELEQIRNYEKEGCIQLDLIAGCFGRIMGEILAYQEDHWKETLYQMGFYLGKFIYIMDAYEDYDEDQKKNRYNPLTEIHKREDYEPYMQQILCMMAGECSAAFERLPCLLDVDILRNILYGGIWGKYRKMQMEKAKKQNVEKEAEQEAEDTKAGMENREAVRTENAEAEDTRTDTEEGMEDMGAARTGNTKEDGTGNTETGKTKDE